MDMNTMTLPKKGLKKYNYNIDMNKRDLKKLTKAQLIKLLLKQQAQKPRNSVKHEDIIQPPEQFRDKTNDLILNLTPENVTQHSRIVITTSKGSSTPTKMSKIIGRQIH